MQNLSRAVLIVLACGLLLMGCRKQDAEPYYNYIGGTGGNAPGDTTLKPPDDGEQTDLTQGDEARDLEYGMIDVTACTDLFSQPNGSGFITSDADLDTKWAAWCPSVDEPATDFDNSIIGYYFATQAPCEDISFKGVRTDGDNIIVDIEHTKQVAPEGETCMCTMMLVKKRFVFSTELVGESPAFNDITTEIPCGSPAPTP